MILDSAHLDALERDPHNPIAGRWNRSAFTARIEIPDYATKLEIHYGRHPRSLAIDFPFRHFGLSIAFDTAVELAVHDDNRHLAADLRLLLDRFGPLTLRNAYLPDGACSSAQRNIFSSLNFHIDRGKTQEDNISLFWRNPFDPIQRAPRNSQTLILANAAAYMQAVKEGRGEHDFNPSYNPLFIDEEVARLIGSVMVEFDWRAPEGVGEIAIVDNRRMLHASYYERPWNKGYPISVRYLF